MKEICDDLAAECEELDAIVAATRSAYGVRLALAASSGLPECPPSTPTTVPHAAKSSASQSDNSPSTVTYSSVRSVRFIIERVGRESSIHYRICLGAVSDVERQSLRRHTTHARFLDA